jgi:hypothetical protein
MSPAFQDPTKKNLPALAIVLTRSTAQTEGTFKVVFVPVCAVFVAVPECFLLMDDLFLCVHLEP